MAGLTALRSLEVGGFVLGKRVLVTGASGGVGRFAIQLARLAGARVTAVSRRGAGLAELGASEVLPELEHSRSGAADLRRLAELVAAGRLDPQIDRIGSWREAGEAIEALLGRSVGGKAVLTID